MTRWIVISILAVVAIGIWIYAVTPKGLPVVAAQAKRATIRAYVEERARSRLPEIHRVTMPLQGRILPIEFEEGDTVEANQVVARMDASDLDTELREAQNTVAQYEKSLEQVLLAIQQAEQTVLVSREKYEFFEREFGRALELFRRQSVAESRKNEAELKMIESRVDLRKDELNKDMYTIGKSIFELLRDNEIGKQDKARRDRERAVIRTPVAGVVLQREVSNERVLQAGDVLLEIGSMNDLEIVVEVLTQDAVRIKVGDAVDIEGAALGDRTVTGHVARIFPQGFTKVSSLGVEQQRVNVIVSFNPDAIEQLKARGIQLGADYRLRVKIYTDQRDDAIVIPRSAVFRSTNGDWQAFVIANSKAELRTLKVGLRNDFQVEVVSGIEEGEPVIVAPESELTNGQLVEPKAAVID